MRPLITAIRTLTCLPIPGPDASCLASALPYFPTVGLLIGSTTLGVLYGLSLSGWTTGAGIAAMIAAVWITRGLHVDGLADVTDALGAGRTRERRLEIMKDPHIGTFGVIAIVCNLALKATSLEMLANLSQWSLVLLPFIVSRTAQVMLACTLPYARPEGGKAGAFVENARMLHLILAIIVATIFCIVISGWAGAAVLLQGLIVGMLLRFWMKHHFGGVTGDLLGMSNEIIETGLLTFLAFISPGCE